MVDKFKIYDLVEIISTGSELDGIRGKVYGISSRHYGVEFYMIGSLDRLPSDRPDVAVNIIGSCLKKV